MEFAIKKTSYFLCRWEVVYRKEKENPYKHHSYFFYKKSAEKEAIRRLTDKQLFVIKIPS